MVQMTLPDICHILPGFCQHDEILWGKKWDS